MNKHGTPSNLIPAHPGNKNAVRHGVHSPRLIEERATEIEAELLQAYEFSPVERLALREVARCMAILAAIDRDLDERGLLDKRGRPHYLLEYRFRVSRQLNQWLTKVSETIERRNAMEEDLSHVDRSTYVRELQRIALGKGSSAKARDRLSALRELLTIAEDEGDIVRDTDASSLPSAQSPLVFKTYEVIQETLRATLKNGQPDLKTRAKGIELMRTFVETFPDFEAPKEENGSPG